MGFISKFKRIKDIVWSTKPDLQAPEVTEQTYVSSQYVAYRYPSRLDIFKIDPLYKSQVTNDLVQVKSLIIKHSIRTWLAIIPEGAEKLSNACDKSPAESADIDLQDNSPANVELDYSSARKELSYHLCLHVRPTYPINHPVHVSGEGVELMMAPEKDFRQVKREFDRIAESLLVELFPAYFGSTQLAQGSAAAPRRSVLVRFLRALVPWVGGAAIFIALAIMFSPSKAPRLASAPAASQAMPSAQQLSQISLMGGGGKNGGGFDDAILNEAWSKLPKDQQDTLMSLTQGAAGKISADQALSNLKYSSVTPSLDAAQMARLESAARITMGSTSSQAPVLYVFEDPMCSTCRRFARETKSLHANHQIRVIPVGLMNGSEELAVAAMCSANPSGSWDSLMNGVFSDVTACDKGAEIIKANNALFHALGLDATPTLVSVTGKTMTGSDSAANIAQWVASNSR